MNERNVVYIHNKILFSLKKEWSTDKCCKTDEPGRYYVNKRSKL